MKTKINILLIMAIVLIIGGTAKTYSLYFENSGQLVNTFTKIKNTDIIINETFDGFSKEDVSFLIDADVPSFIRAKIVINYLDEDGNIVSFKPVEGEDYMIKTNPEWIYKDRFYYLKDPVTYGDTPVLIEKLVNLNKEYKLAAEILVQSSNREFE